MSTTSIKKIPLWLIVSIIFYITLLFGASFLKYYFHLYNAYDLAIFNQVFWNSANGDWFASSINPPSYFGDHFAPVLAFFIPLYTLFPSPLTLLFLQTIFLGFAAFPLYFIAKKYLPTKWRIVVVLAWLLNPFIHSINLYEFHILSMMPLLLFSLWYFFIQQRFIAYAVTLLIILLVREDTGLATASMGFLMLFSKQHNKHYRTYGTATIILSLLWVAVALTIVGAYNIDGSYKFLAYYGWLGSSLPEIIVNVITHPGTILLHIARFDTLTMWFIMLLPLLFIPLIAPVYLIGLILPLLQIYLIQNGGRKLIPFMHYSAWFHPVIFLALIGGLAKILKRAGKTLFKIKITNERKTLLYIVFIVGIIYFFITLSPATYTLYYVTTNKDELVHTKQVKESIIEQIGAEQVIASNEFLAELSSRKALTDIRYLIANRYQLSHKKFDFPENAAYIAVSQQELIVYRLLAMINESYTQELGQKLNTFIQPGYQPVKINSRYILFKKNAPGSFSYYEELVTVPDGIQTAGQATGTTLSFIGWQPPNNMPPTDNALIITTYWRGNGLENVEPIDWKVTINTKEGKRRVVVIPPSMGLVPTDRWPNGAIIKSVFLIPIPYHMKKSDIETLTLAPIRIRGKHVLNRFSNSEYKIENTINLEPTVTLSLTHE